MRVRDKPVSEWVRELQGVDGIKMRTRRLNEVMGEPSADPTELHQRALLITELSRRGVWPSTKPSA